MKLFKKKACILFSSLLAVALITTASAEESVPRATVTVGEKSTSYSTCAEGWNAAVKAAQSTENVVFTLKSDWRADKSGSFGTGSGFKDGAVYCSAAKLVTMDLNGHTLDRDFTVSHDDGAVIYVASELVIKDSSPTSGGISENVTGGIITGGYNDDNGGGIVLLEGATLNLNGGTIANCISNSDGGAIYLDNEKASLYIDGAMLYGNHSYDGSGGAVYCDDGMVIIDNAIIEGNHAEDDGGAIYMDEGKITVTNTSFYGNSALEEGGAVYLADGTQSEMEACTFMHNYSEDGGGAVYVNSDDGTNIKSCTMLCNTCDENGGALYTNGDKVFIVGGNYQQNTAAEKGGGIYVDSMYDINIAGKLVVKNNTVNGKENNLCLQDSTFTTAYLYCGGLYEGSEIWLSSSDEDDRLAVANIDAYQYRNYINFDDGFSEDRLEIHQESQDDIRAAGSALGDGNYLTVAILGGAVAVIAVALVIYAVRKKERSGDR